VRNAWQAQKGAVDDGRTTKSTQLPEPDGLAGARQLDRKISMILYLTELVHLELIS
jgi:hypothetical protein